MGNAWSEEEILKHSETYREVIAEFNSGFCQEIEAIAAGADIDPRWVYAINSRSELMQGALKTKAKKDRSADGCTVVADRKAQLLAQNWDWCSALEDLTVVLEIHQKDYPTVMMVTEPGIIGKIGLNSAGIGVTLTRLTAGKKYQGATDQPCVPVHVLMRSILESPDYQSAVGMLKKHAGGKYACLCVAGPRNKTLMAEMAGNKASYLTENVDSRYFVHTNHYSDDVPKKDTPSQSVARMKTAVKLLKEYKKEKDMAKSKDTSLTVEYIKQVLTHSKDAPIAADYGPHLELPDRGTVCSIVMELDKRVLHVTLGNPLRFPWVKMGLGEPF
eukprot:TRINITY_DN47638_c0_g1_i1.p1 TRINITY_DN47638_c0_g1~~TRINITY_DN47638_c0_g1_i1.p1  ORF type:complete len:378 (-),score=37.84 TRINITY_DN47638_c0_g1_i1:515-1504(-)